MLDLLNGASTGNNDADNEQFYWTVNDKLTCCLTWDLATPRVLWWCSKLCSVHSARAVSVKDGLPWMMFPLLLGGRNGWTDSCLYLSLINLGDGVEQCLYLINKRDTAYAFPHMLASGPRRCEVGQRYFGMEEDVKLGPKISFAIEEFTRTVKKRFSKCLLYRTSWEVIQTDVGH